MSITIQTNTACKLIKNSRNFWQWINIIFNKVDEERRRNLGPDRTCAEWLLRNGANVKFVGVKEYTTNYNNLPPEGAIFYIQEVDASESSIMHHGFPHFVGCKFINKIVLHRCDYLEDEAMKLLEPLKVSLTDLRVTSCRNLTDEGVIALGTLGNLKRLILGDLPYVRDKKKVLDELKGKLPQCSVTYE